MLKWKLNHATVTLPNGALQESSIMSSHTILPVRPWLPSVHSEWDVNKFKTYLSAWSNVWCSASFTVCHPAPALIEAKSRGPLLHSWHTFQSLRRMRNEPKEGQDNQAWWHFPVPKISYVLTHSHRTVLGTWQIHFLWSSAGLGHFHTSIALVTMKDDNFTTVHSLLSSCYICLHSGWVIPHYSIWKASCF